MTCLTYVESADFSVLTPGLTNITVVEPNREGACFIGNRGVVMVPYHVGAVEMAQDAFRGDGRHSHGDKKFLLSFAGSMAFDAEQYSHFYYGVRQRVFRLFHENPLFRVVERSPDMQKDIHESTFCLTPSGWGAPGHRVLKCS